MSYQGIENRKGEETVQSFKCVFEAIEKLLARDGRALYKITKCCENRKE